MQTVFILSLTSDIGKYLALRYVELGFQVIGTTRSLRKLDPQLKHTQIKVIACDVKNPLDVSKLKRYFSTRQLQWDIFISCVGDPLPVTSFFEGDFKQWSDSVYVNAQGQLHALHCVHPFRNKSLAHVVFFAGGGSNGAVVNFSAYTASKIFLTKMCELLDAENPDLNVFIVGPGWTRTKIHQTILKDKRTSAKKISETKNFLSTGTGTPFEDIFDSIDWLISQGKPIASGRNFSIVHDPWRLGKRAELVKALKKDSHMYKLRRHGNAFMQQS